MTLDAVIPSTGKLPTTTKGSSDKASIARVGSLGRAHESPGGGSPPTTDSQWAGVWQQRFASQRQQRGSMLGPSSPIPTAATGFSDGGIHLSTWAPVMDQIDVALQRFRPAKRSVQRGDLALSPLSNLAIITVALESTKTRWQCLLCLYYTASILMPSLLCGCDWASSSGTVASTELDAKSRPSVAANVDAPSNLTGDSGVEKLDGKRRISRDLSEIQRRWDSSNPVEIQTLWSAVTEKYATSQRYSDQGQLHLHYQLLGRPMVESHPMQIAFDRAQQQWTCLGFRSELWASSAWVLMRIHERATRNLDGQLKLLRRTEALHAALSADAVAQVYLSGATDLPVASTSQQELALWAPQIRWLLADLSKPAGVAIYAGVGWLGQWPCVRVRLQTEGVASVDELWISPEDLTIRRVNLSAEHLSSVLHESPEVTDIQLTLDLNGATFGESSRPAQPWANDLGACSPQRMFVKIPESFPTPWIDRATNEVATQSQAGDTWFWPSRGGLPTVGLLLPQTSATQSDWDTLANWSKNQAKPVQVAIVLDGHDPSPPAKNVMFSPALPQGPGLIPSGYRLWETLGLTRQRWLVAWDGQGKLQYVGVLPFEWDTEQLDGLLLRLHRQERIGEEMIKSYQSFWDNYLTERQAQEWPQDICEELRATLRASSSSVPTTSSSAQERTSQDPSASKPMPHR